MHELITKDAGNNLVKTQVLSPFEAVFNKRDAVTASGTYTAPITGWYKVTVKSGGGGGGAPMQEYSHFIGGGGGGEGGTYIGWCKMNAGDTATCVIGAGGIGASGIGASATDGGNSSFAGGGIYFVAWGGDGPGSDDCRAGADGGTGTIYGAAGTPGQVGPPSYGRAYGGTGGGAGSRRGAMSNVPLTARGGAGGNGGGWSNSVSHGAGSGGNGYIYIEYFDPNK